MIGASRQIAIASVVASHCKLATAGPCCAKPIRSDRAALPARDRGACFSFFHFLFFQFFLQQFFLYISYVHNSSFMK
jgi:hypothetical protein